MMNWIEIMAFSSFHMFRKSNYSIKMTHIEFFCPFFSGFAPAIGVFGTNTLKMEGNVMHNTVGSAMVVWGDKNEIIDNLIVSNLWASVFNGRKEVNNKMEGAVEIGE